MPPLEEHPSAKVVKALIIADSGKGKTGALASLANAGYKLRIQDYDNGLDVLRHYVKPECMQNVEYVTLTDKLQDMGGKVVPVGVPDAYTRGAQLLMHWRYYTNGAGKAIPGVPPQPVKNQVTGEMVEPAGGPFKAYDFGRISEWGPDTVYVLDSLTLHGNACMRFVLNLGKRDGQQPWQSDYGTAMDYQEKLLELLYSEGIRCHVLVLSHVSYIQREEGANVGYPSALGNKLPPKVPRYFNAVLQVECVGAGQAQRRFIRTASMGLVQLKNPLPAHKVPLELPIETGLADYFRLATKG